MEIGLATSYCYNLVVEADNVKIVEDIESREYPLDENGKVIINLNPIRDIKTEYLEMIANLLDDMIYYRKADFDSSSLIERLFQKLPANIAIRTIKYLKEEYE